MVDMQGESKGECATTPGLNSILIAEDEHLLVQTLKSDLVALGYTIHGPVSNGESAIDLARQEVPDLALLDIRMSGMDGLTAAKTIHDEMGIPCVILSAYSNPDYVFQATETGGVYGYLLKPASVDELRVTLGIAWDRFCAQRDLANANQDLERKLEERKLIERAKGILMQRLNLSEPEAMKKLQKQARDSRRPMVELAKSLLEAEGLLEK